MEKAKTKLTKAPIRNYTAYVTKHFQDYIKTFIINTLAMSLPGNDVMIIFSTTF